jgi:hypothetical protein
MPEGILMLMILFLLFYTYFKINPKMDINYETEDIILWYNDPFELFKRKPIRLWKVKKK